MHAQESLFSLACIRYIDIQISDFVHEFYGMILYMSFVEHLAVLEGI